MIGWGVDKETGAPYWTCVNSWNKAWGEEGDPFYHHSLGTPLHHPWAIVPSQYINPHTLLIFTLNTAAQP